MIVAKSPQTVDSKKDDGFAALHLACLNGHLKVAEILINKVRSPRFSVMSPWVSHKVSYSFREEQTLKFATIASKHPSF